MADKKKDLLTEEEQTGQLVQLWHHFQSNPWQYIGGAAFLLFCGLAGALYSASQDVSNRRITTAIAEATLTEEDALRAAELESLADTSGDWTPTTIYLAAEAALRAREYDKARELFENLVNNHPNYERTPEAAYGLAFIKENSGDLDGALEGYQDVMNRWDSSFIGRQQPFYIARVQEAQGNVEGAIESYRSQTTLWPESQIAARAQRELDRLKGEHPDLFPEEVAPISDLNTGDAVVEEAVSEVPAEDASAEPPADTEPAVAVEAMPVEEAVEAVVEVVEEAVEEAAPEAEAAPAAEVVPEAAAPVEEVAPEAPVEEAPAN